MLSESTIEWYRDNFFAETHYQLADELLECDAVVIKHDGVQYLLDVVNGYFGYENNEQILKAKEDWGY